MIVVFSLRAIMHEFARWSRWSMIIDAASKPKKRPDPLIK
jgi:hypothetical protein